MKTILYSALFLVATSVACSNNTDSKGSSASADSSSVSTLSLAEQAIAIHDEIMPQISTFDKHTLKIDSLLADGQIWATQGDEDAISRKKEGLTVLKHDLEAATDLMMVWMKEYDLDNKDEAYQQQEIQKVTEMKAEFERVSAEANTLLSTYQ